MLCCTWPQIRDWHPFESASPSAHSFISVLMKVGRCCPGPVSRLGGGASAGLTCGGVVGYIYNLLDTIERQTNGIQLCNNHQTYAEEHSTLLQNVGLEHHLQLPCSHQDCAHHRCRRIHRSTTRPTLPINLPAIIVDHHGCLGTSQVRSGG